MDPKVKELRERLEQERAGLARYGYEWPAIFDAVNFLLERAHIVPDKSDDV